MISFALVHIRLALSGYIGTNISSPHSAYKMSGNYDSSNPIFNSSMGAIILIDNLFRLASENLIDQELDQYRNTLEALYLEIIFWVRKKYGGNYDDEKDEYKDPKNVLKHFEDIRMKSSDYNLVYLKKYHELLNKYANECNLRLKASSNMLGVLQE